MTTISYNNLLTRVTEIQIDALSAISVTCDAKPYFYHTQEAFPYFTNRIGSIAIDGVSNDFARPTVNVIMRLVVAHLTEDYDGSNEALLYTYMRQVEIYFASREYLQSTANPTILTGLRSARITNISGLVIAQFSTGINALQVGTEFTLSVEYDDTVNPAFNS